MARLFYILSLLIFSYSAIGQTIIVNPSTVDFGTIFTDDPDTVDVIISNTSAYPQVIYDVNIYNSDFTVLDTFFNMAANGVDTIQVIFHPRHNIKYNTEMVLLTELFTGHIAVDMIGTGKYRDTYYDQTQNLSEEALKLALKNIISTGYNSLGYNLARDRMFMIIDNKKVNGEGATVNTLECVYTGRIITGFADRQQAQNMGFNTEHTFPQSTFNQAEPQRSDLFHLFPTDATANSVRSNDPFRYVTNPTWQVGGSKSSGSTFEVRDEQKGQTARAMLYFLIRYGNPQNYVNTTDQAVLREWHNLYLPDSIEMRRNNAIQVYQNNRNPFIDHPEFTERITSFISTSSAPQRDSIVVTEDTIDAHLLSVGDTFKYYLVIVNTGNTIAAISNATASGDAYVHNVDTPIDPGENGVIEVHVLPSNTGNFSETLTFTNTNTNTTYTLPIHGQVFPSSVTDPNLSQIAIYPNPVQNKLNYEVAEESQIMVTDITGRILISKKVSSSGAIDMEEFTTGTYIMVVKQKDKLFQQKIFKF